VTGVQTVLFRSLAEIPPAEAAEDGKQDRDEEKFSQETIYSGEEKD
jgi:hypothetical protein